MALHTLCVKYYPALSISQAADGLTVRRHIWCGDRELIRAAPRPITPSAHDVCNNLQAQSMALIRRTALTG